MLNDHLMQIMIIWLVVWNIFYDFPYIGNNSSSQLTFTPSFFKGVGLKPPTRLLLTIIDHMTTIYKPLSTVY